MAIFMPLLTIFIAGSILSVSGNSQTVRLYSNTNSRGSNVFIQESYSHDLRNQHFDKMAQSACVRGVWLFYEHYNYNTGTNNGRMEFYYHVGDQQNCVDFQEIRGRVSSVRFAGRKNNFRADTITLYENTYFRGAQETTEYEIPEVRLRTASIIVTGNQAWTLYEQPRFKGAARCIHTNGANHVPEFIQDTAVINLRHGVVKSVRRGCAINGGRGKSIF